MPSIFRKETFEAKYRRFRIALYWLIGMGLRVGQTRLLRYRRVIKAFIKAKQTNDTSQFVSSGLSKDLIDSWLGVTETIYIYKGLAAYSRKDSAMIKRLKDFISGPARRDDERIDTSSHLARDICFELQMASLLVASGYQVDFGTNADMVIHETTGDIFIECKRPSSPRKLEYNIRIAEEQLVHRYSSSHSQTTARGFIAISLSKIFNKQNNILRIPKDHEFGETVAAILLNFKEKNERLWQSKMSPQTLGIILHIDVMASLEQEGILSTAVQLVVNNNAYISPQEMGRIQIFSNNILRGVNDIITDHVWPAGIRIIIGGIFESILQRIRQKCPRLYKLIQYPTNIFPGA